MGCPPAAAGDVAGGAVRAGFEPIGIFVDSFQTHGVHARAARLAAAGVITEERPGTYVFADHQQVVIRSCRAHDVALSVASTVVSRAVAGQVVLDAGTKSLGRETQP